MPATDAASANAGNGAAFRAPSPGATTRVAPTEAIFQTALTSALSPLEGHLRVYGLQYFGLDFGTTNTSLAWVREDGGVTLCVLDLLAPKTNVLRSLLYYSLDERGFVVGQRAIDEYLEENMQGTLIQSVKTFLADDSFEETFVHDRFYRLEDLISFIFRHVHAVIRALISDEDFTVVIGRPAIFVERPEKEAIAQERMRKAAQLARFFNVRFLYEPIAAGLTYESQLDKPEVALIADLGGGTTDFTVMRLGTRARGERRDDILASGGVQIGGDTFDARIMMRKISPHFGAGTTFRSMEGRDQPFPQMLLARLSRWHHVAFLRAPKTQEQLRRIRWTSNAPERLAAFEELVDGNYSFFLFREIERAKSELSFNERATVRFHREGLHIEEPLERDQFEEMISDDLARVETRMRLVLDESGVPDDKIDAVFLTGGSAQIPAVHRLFERTFGPEKLRSEDYLTSVAYGLGLSAARET